MTRVDGRRWLQGGGHPETSTFLAVLLVLQQVPAGAPAARPVRITLEPRTVASGEAVHVFVDVATAGQLLVLRVTTDGGTEVVFPSQPSEGSYISAGSYEIRPPGRTSAFTANERPGGGVVLAALAPVPYEFNEFVRDGAWDARALASGTGSDATGWLLDVVQRMLGPEYFHYDVATYAVERHPSVASLVAGAVPSSAGDEWVVWVPVSLCSHARPECGFPRSWCDGFLVRGRCGRPCWEGFGCREPPMPAPEATLALYRRGVPQIVSPAASTPATTAPVAPRDRDVVVSAPSPGGWPTATPSRGSGVAVVPARRVLPAAARDRVGTGRRAGVDAAVSRQVSRRSTVVARGTRTSRPSVSPREARLRQSASRPPLPERVPWPTGATPPRSAQPMSPTAKPIAAALAPQEPAPQVPRVTGAVPVARAGGSHAAPASGVSAAVTPSAPARATRGSAVSTTPARTAGGARAYVPPPAAPASTGARASGGRSGKP